MAIFEVSKGKLKAAAVTSDTPQLASMVSALSVP